MKKTGPSPRDRPGRTTSRPSGAALGAYSDYFSSADGDGVEAPWVHYSLSPIRSVVLIVCLGSTLAVLSLRAAFRSRAS